MSGALRAAVVVVTGASAGIGRECVLAFAREGARVAAGARRLERLESLAGEVRALGSEALVLRTDVAVEEDVRRLVAAAVERFGRLDVMVNNAGYGVRGTVETTPAETCLRLMRVNYLGTLYGCQAALPVMRRQGSGVIINVSSIVGHRALPTGGAYAATKAAQISLTEALRAELRGSGIHACSVHPVGTRTEFGEVSARESGEDVVAGVGPQQSPRTVAETIVRCARRPRAEAYPYPLSRAIVWLNALAPGLSDWLAWRAARGAGRI
ncbi:MAG TPA: SDR family NAD(P)-dependent oxidoreductase [Vicinamibacteria bacterium]|nr:SDR family NAD(P)-dependent oxidoreductase [Vicinamibacteria bacterium]